MPENSSVMNRSFIAGRRKTLSFKETLSNSLRGKNTNDAKGLPIGRLAHKAQEPRHIEKYIGVTSTARQAGVGNSPAQRINQCFLNRGSSLLAAKELL